jgi:hypothetical protein
MQARIPQSGPKMFPAKHHVARCAILMLGAAFAMSAEISEAADSRGEIERSSARARLAYEQLVALGARGPSTPEAFAAFLAQVDEAFERLLRESEALSESSTALPADGLLTQHVLVAQGAAHARAALDHWRPRWRWGLADGSPEPSEPNWAELDYVTTTTSSLWRIHLQELERALPLIEHASPAVDGYAQWGWSTYVRESRGARMPPSGSPGCDAASIAESRWLELDRSLLAWAATERASGRCSAAERRSLSLVLDLFEGAIRYRHVDVHAAAAQLERMETVLAHCLSPPGPTNASREEVLEAKKAWSRQTWWLTEQYPAGWGGARLRDPSNVERLLDSHPMSLQPEDIQEKELIEALNSEPFPACPPAAPCPPPPSLERAAAWVRLAGALLRRQPEAQTPQLRRTNLRAAAFCLGSAEDHLVYLPDEVDTPRSDAHRDLVLEVERLSWQIVDAERSDWCP